MQLLANTTSPFVRIARVVMIEKGLDVEPTIVDPWADDGRLRAANAATRVPTLVLDDGTALSECLLIVQWLEATWPAPAWPNALGASAALLFDETPVGLRRRRTMVEGLQRLEALADDLALPAGETAPTLDVIAAVTLFDYQQMRYGDQPWLPDTPRLRALAEAWRARPSMAKTIPYMA
jgi:glutathione S-transferase